MSSNTVKWGTVLAVRLHHTDRPALALVTHVNDTDKDTGLPSVDVVAFPRGELTPRVATGVLVYDSETDLNDAADEDPKVDAPHVAAFWPDDNTGSDVKPAKPAKSVRPKTAE